MTALDRRRLLTAGLAGASVAAAAASSAVASPASTRAAHAPIVPDLPQSGDATGALQGALDAAARTGAAVLLPPGTFTVAPLEIAAGVSLTGHPGTTRLAFSGGGTLLTIAKGARDVTVRDLTLDVRLAGPFGLAAEGAVNLDLDNITVLNAAETAVRLEGSSGRISRCHIADSARTAILASNSRGLSITDTTITRCGDNGILVWRSEKGPDGTIVTGNRISHITAISGGSGQNGNGINVFRAADVIVANNHISDCAFTAIRANSAPNVQMTGNACHRLGEVAIYAEFAFDGAVIAQNLIDTAATGISVTNFNDGGRLATVQGNLVRNLFRRDFEPVDKRGIGIFVEADTSVTGNTVENAAEAGIVVGHERYMRDCAVTGNVVRASPYGILVSADRNAGACLVANNLISGATQGAIRAHDGGRAIGRDLSTTTTTTGRVTIVANLAV